eukprot:2482391-Amphidinium_carterae.1
MIFVSTVLVKRRHIAFVTSAEEFELSTFNSGLLVPYEQSLESFSLTTLTFSQEAVKLVEESSEVSTSQWDPIQRKTAISPTRSPQQVFLTRSNLFA